MPTQHELKEGESLVPLGQANGLQGWQTILSDGENAELRAKRKNPNALLPGDVVSIPDTKSKEVLVPTDERHRFIAKIPRGVWSLAWTPNKCYCGDKPELKGETNLTSDKVGLKLSPRQEAPIELPTLDPAIADEKLSPFKWEIKDVSFKPADADPLPAREIETTTRDDTIPCNVAVLTIEAMHEAPEKAFSANRAWSGFTNHSSFKQSIAKYRCQVKVHFKILKAWGAYWVNLQSAGIAGLAGGCPWAGHRWGRSTGANAMAPDQYYDGANWVAFPAGFALTGTNHSATGFYKSGANFVSTSGGTWPGAFAEYNFNSATYSKRRADWIKNTHKVWTDKWHIRRKKCASKKGTRCCLYEVEVNMTFTRVNTHSTGVVAVCPGALRSNAAIWFMDDDRIEVAAHEAGHHMDNPDEYVGGAVNPAVNGDGAVNGIDSDCIMGANLSKVKKRHYRSFATMVRKLIKAKYGRDEQYIVVAK